MARARPSSAEQIAAMRVSCAAPGRCQPADVARSMNSASASSSANPPSGNTCSNGTAKRALLVTSTVSRGHAVIRRSTITATAFTTCSQLSRTSSAGSLPSPRIRDCSTSRPAMSATPQATATAGDTPASSETGTRSTCQVRPRNSSARSSATARANRVLPAPPVPTTLTSRDERIASARAARSVARPTKLVSGATATGPDVLRRAAAYRTRSRCAGRSSLRRSEAT